MAPRSTRTGLAVALAVVAALVGLACAWWMHTGTIAAPTIAGTDAPVSVSADPGPAPAVAAVVSVLASVPDVAVEALLPRVAVSRTRVSGVARSGAGDPLAAWQVRLWWNKPRTTLPGKIDNEHGTVRAVRHARTAADGTFAFEDLAPGDFGIELADAGVAPLGFSLARDEDKWVELRGAGASVELQLVRFGEAVARGRVSLSAGNQVIDLTTDDAGIGRCLLAPGAWDVRVFNEIWPAGPTSVQTRLMPAGARATWRLETGGGGLQVDAAYADGSPCRQFSVRLDGTLATGERAVREFPSGEGTARIARVPPGRWQVSVKAAHLSPTTPREVALDNAMPRAHLAFVVSPGAIVWLSLRRDGVPFGVDVDASRLPWLVSDDSAVRPQTGRKAAKSPLQLGFIAVPPGPARLVAEDRFGTEGVEFLPFDPHAPVAIDVQLGRDNDVAIDVVPRAKVDLRACEAGGREDLGARVAVYTGVRPVLGLDSRAAYRWSGWLPPGDYRVVVDRKGVLREDALHVERADVSLRLRP